MAIPFDLVIEDLRGDEAPFMPEVVIDVVITQTAADYRMPPPDRQPACG